MAFIHWLIRKFSRKQSNVAQYLGMELSPIRSSADFLGQWTHRYHAGPPLDNPMPYEYFLDGTLVNPWIEPGEPRTLWSMQSGAYLETLWCAPTEHLPEGAWDESPYCCAKSHDGQIVLWNSDGSVIRVLSRELEGSNG